MKLPKSLQRFVAVIEDYSDERESGDGIWVYLKPGFVSLMETGIVHEDTIAEVITALGDCAPINKGAPNA